MCSEPGRAGGAALAGDGTISVFQANLPVVYESVREVRLSQKHLRK